MLFGQLEGVFQPVTGWGIFQVVKIKQVWAANKEVLVHIALEPKSTSYCWKFCSFIYSLTTR